MLTLQPKVLVLDEPTSQLDPQAAEEVLTTLQKLNSDLGLTIVLSEHRLERVVQYVDQLLYMPGEGQPPLVGPPSEVLDQVDLCPPLVTLAKELGWDPLPLTIKEGQRFAKRLQLQSSLFPSPAPLADGTKPVGAKPQPAVNVSDLWFSYGQREALCGLHLTVKQGEFVALMGRNGSGKTTLLKQIMGLLHPDRGRVELWGEDTRRLKTEAIVQRVGYLPQNPNALLFADTLRDELDFTRRSQGLSLGGYEEFLRALGLEQHINAYPRDLSVGERQRAALAAILVAGPEVILLDEPTRGLDYPQKRALADFLTERCRQGKTVVMSTHDVELVARCADRVVILGEGQVVVDGPVRAVMTESLVFSSQINKLFRDDRFLTVEDVLEVIGG